MTDFEIEQDLPPVAHVTITFLGPVSPHWEIKTHYGDQKVVDDFWTRVMARLLLLPKHDPQFRRNRERVNRDAERERIVCSWDLGDDDDETTIEEPQPPVEAEDVVAEAADEVVDPGPETADETIADVAELAEESTEVSAEEPTVEEAAEEAAE